MSDESRVFLFDSSDPEMQAAYQRARDSFRFFWRELAWERRRIIPALTLACVKAPFDDGDQADPDSEDPSVEHMWLDEIDFDGRDVTGTLLNAPNWLKTINEGDRLTVPLTGISDWMYSFGDEVYGAHTVNLLRSRMDPEERAAHDEAWGGLDFGKPPGVRLTPKFDKGGLLKSLFGGSKAPETIEHPMSENMAASLREHLAGDRSCLTDRDEQGWTLLHHQALAGSAASVQILLEHGADPQAATDHGMTARQLAEALGWPNVLALLPE